MRTKWFESHASQTPKYLLNASPENATDLCNQLALTVMICFFQERVEEEAEADNA